MLNKVCTKCHKRQSKDNFVSDSNKSDGLYSSCKDCYRARIGSTQRPEWHGKVKYINNIECRYCSGCKKYLDCDFFYKRANNYSDTRCKDCVMRVKKLSNYKELDKKRRDNLRLDIITHYSSGNNICNCCGEKEFKFLSLDHINGGGNKHRHEVGARGVYRTLKKSGYPTGYQILCYNCNLAKGFYGKCPHSI